MFNFVITYDFGACRRLGQSYYNFPQHGPSFSFMLKGEVRFEKEGEDALDTL